MDEITFDPVFCPECREYVGEVQLRIKGRIVWVCEQCGQTLTATRQTGHQKLERG